MKPSLHAKMLELTAAVESVGALGAEIRLRQSGAPGHPALRPALQRVVEALGPGLLDDAEPFDLAVIFGQLRYALQEALDLIAAPEREPGWSYTEPAILQERGRGSRRVVSAMVEAARRHPSLAAALERGRAFLDVGTGVGFIGIEMVKCFPRMHAVGIDILEPALALAAQNIAAEQVGERMTLRNQSIAAIDDEDAFDLVWLPSMFLPVEVLDASLPRILRALRPDGVLVLGMFATKTVPHGAALREVLTIRSGGVPWSPDAIAARLNEAGFAEVEYVPIEQTADFVLARRS
jgi:SAM-dependent methyltransferase